MTEGDTELQNTSGSTVEGLQEGPAGDDYGDFPPGTIVLAKLKSFPPWPAIVIPYELIPENVYKSKPKPASQHQSNSRSKRRSIAPRHKNDQEADNKLWCVRFLRDDTYMWGFRKDISLLTKDEIQEYLNGKKGKKLIRSAYEMAMNPPDVEEFIIYGSNGKPIEIDNEANDAEFIIDADADEDEGEEEGDNGDEGSLVDDDDDEDEDLEIDDIKPTSKKRTKASTKSSKRTKTTQQKKKGKKANSRVSQKYKAPPEPETSSDEDWDEDHGGDEPVITDFPDSKKLISEVNRLRPILQRARIRFQRFYLDLNNLEFEQDISENSSLFKDSNKSLEQLEKNEDIPKSMIKHYQIHKILIDFLKRSDLNLKNSQIRKIRQRVDRLLTDWFDLEVKVDPNWDLSKEHNDDTEEVKREEQEVEVEAQAQDSDGKEGSINAEETEKKVTAQTPDGNDTNSLIDQKNDSVNESNNGD